MKSELSGLGGEIRTSGKLSSMQAIGQYIEVDSQHGPWANTRTVVMGIAAIFTCACGKVQATSF